MHTIKSLSFKRFYMLVIALLCFVVAPTLALATVSPIDVIKSGTDKTLKILDNHPPGKKSDLRAHRGEILNIIDKYFDFNEMAKRALGRPWKDQTPAKQQEFVNLFQNLLFNTYVDRVEGYTSSNEKIVYQGQQIVDRYAIVRTMILNYQNSNISVDYRLALENGQWKVYDVVIEGISLVNNYRSQFSSILSRDSFDKLLQLLREKVQSQQKSS